MLVTSFHEDEWFFSSSQMWFMWWLLTRNNGQKSFATINIYMRVRFVVGELLHFKLVVLLLLLLFI